MLGVLGWRQRGGDGGEMEREREAGSNHKAYFK